MIWVTFCDLCQQLLERIPACPLLPADLDSGWLFPQRLQSSQNRKCGSDHNILFSSLLFFFKNVVEMWPWGWES